MRNKYRVLTTLISIVFLLQACSTKVQNSKNNDFTYGSVELHLKKGSTKQTEVLKEFGPPNITTNDGDEEVWTYQRHSTSSRSSSKGASFFGVIGGFSGESAQSSKSMILILRFVKSKILTDFHTRYSSF